jgi:uncharacterized protein (TIGR00251 family)
LTIKVVPSSSRTSLAGWVGDTLKVRVTAPAEKGAANAAVEEFLADVLELQRRAVHIVAGRAQPRKVIEIIGLSEAEVRARLSRPAD